MIIPWQGYNIDITPSDFISIENDIIHINNYENIKFFY